MENSERLKDIRFTAFVRGDDQRRISVPKLLNDEFPPDSLVEVRLMKRGDEINEIRDRTNRGREGEKSLVKS